MVLIFKIVVRVDGEDDDLWFDTLKQIKKTNLDVILNLLDLNHTKPTPNNPRTRLKKNFLVFF